METIRIYFILLLILSLLVPDVFSQSTNDNNLSGEITYNSFPQNYKNIAEEFQYHKNKDFNDLIKINKSVSNTIPLIDSVITYTDAGRRWKYSFTHNSQDKLTSELKENLGDNLNLDNSRVKYTYDSENNITMELGEQWENNKWVNFRRTTYTFDSIDDMTSVVIENEKWQEDHWIRHNYKRFTYVYDSKNNMTAKIEEDWKGQWVIERQWTYNYDSVGNLIMFKFENWDGSLLLPSSWRETYIYASDGNNTLIQWENWDGDQWRFDRKRTYSYDSNGNMTSALWEDWRSNLNKWVKYKLKTYVYDSNGNMTSKLSEHWEGDQWIQYFLETYTYDSNGNMTSELSKYWENNQWVKNYKLTYAYNTNGNLLTFTSEFWKDSKWVLSTPNPYGNWSIKLTDSYGNNYELRAAKLELYYNTITDLNAKNIVPSNFSLTQNYPNPFNPSTTIEYSISKQSNVTLKVFDVLGSEVTTLINKGQPQGNYEVELDGSKFTSGIYFYRLQAGNFIETKKMILLK